MSPIRYLFTILLLFLCARTQAQISDSLYHALPDSLQPPDKAHMTSRLKRKIVGLSYFLSLDKFRPELDKLAASLEQDAAAQKDDDEKIAYLQGVMTYHFNNSNDSQAIRMSDLLIREINKAAYSRDRARYKAGALHMNGMAYNHLGAYERGMARLNESKVIYVKEKDGKGLGSIYMDLGNSYMKLGLSRDAIASYDSALNYMAADPYYYSTLTCSQARSYLDLYESDSQPEFKERAAALIKQLFSRRDAEIIRWMSYGYILLARKAYLDKDYAQAIRYTDSAATEKYMQADYEPVITRYMTNIYRGISLLHTARQKEGLALLSRLLASKENYVYKNYDLVSYYTFELYEIMKEEGRWKEALQYYEQYTEAKNAQDIMVNRGKVFEINQKYAVAQKESEIKSLENKNILKEQERNKAVSAVIITLLALLVSLLVFYAVLRKLQYKRKKAELAAAEERKAKEELELLGNIQSQMVKQETIIEQRKEISNEMHDLLGSSLAALKFYVTDLKLNATATESTDLLTRVETETDFVYSQSRHYMHNLSFHAQLLQQEYNDLLYGIFQRLCMNDNTLHFEVDFDHEQVRSVLRPEQYNHLIQITSELITNARKHAAATMITVSVHCSEECCTLAVSDNGTGFDQHNKEGMGLESIRNRVSLLNGHLDIASGASGTTVKIDFPVLYLQL